MVSMRTLFPIDLRSVTPPFPCEGRRPTVWSPGRDCPLQSTLRTRATQRPQFLAARRRVRQMLCRPLMRRTPPAKS